MVVLWPVTGAPSFSDWSTTCSDGLRLWYSDTGFPAPGADQWLLNQASHGADTANSNPATLAGGVTYTANHASTANAATAFDGTTGIETATGPAVISTASYTVSAWVKINNLDSDQMALGQGTVNHQSFYLGYTTGSNGWVFQTTTSDGATTTFPTASALATAGTWTQLTGVYDSTTGTMTLYVNGVAAADTGTNTTPQYNAAGPLTVGAVAAVGSRAPYEYFNGDISDVRAYTGALTADQVHVLYGSS